MSDNDQNRDRINFNKKKLEKRHHIDDDKKMQYKANKQFKQRKLELYDEDSLEEIEFYKK